MAKKLIKTRPKTKAKDGRSVKTAAHRKKISEALKAYHASKGKKPTRGKKTAESRKSDKKPVSFSYWHKQHDANQKARAAANKKFYSSPEGIKIKANNNTILELISKTRLLALKLRYKNQPKVRSEYNKIMTRLRQLRAKNEKLLETYKAKQEKAKKK